MCSIIRLKGTVNDFKAAANVKNMFDNNNIIYRILAAKGGDEFGVKIITNISGHKIYTTIEDTDVVDFLYRVKYFILKTAFGSDVNWIKMLFHSRLAPEMEDNSLLKQPYARDDDIIAVHGTIPNIESIEKRYNIKIPVDTDIYKFLKFSDCNYWVELLEGKVTAISMENEYTNGLGLYSFECEKIEFCTNISDKNYEAFKVNNYKNLSVDQKIQSKFINNPGNNPAGKEIHRYVVLSTGGLDITTSTIHTLANHASSNDEKVIVDHWYFDWGSNAAASEIATVNGLIETYKKYSKTKNHVYNELRVIDIKDMFKNILNVAGVEKVRIADTEAKGEGHNEAESAISYVPFRNTYLITTAASIAEQLYPNESVTFIIGANLSEGMIYLDNSSEWLENMNKLVKVGGQKCFGFNVIAPFVNKTKTEMLIKFKTLAIDMGHEVGFDLRDNTFSCYFPNNGKACGECGSCLLKRIAIGKAGLWL